MHLHEAFATSRSLLYVIGLWTLSSHVAANSANQSCCGILQGLVQGGVVSQNDTTAYQASTAKFWSKQEQEVKPGCFFQPARAQDVAAALQALSRAPTCNFAIKSGGHMAQAGAANIQGGVTIDLGSLTQFNVSGSAGNTSQATIGPGLRWGEVYGKLAAYGMGIPGGRSGNVGVGGYLLGSGSSYFIEHGFGCDNVIGYELVLANGTILDVTASSNSDLFRALKGGSSNFGIVTAFTVRTFPLKGIWGGNIIYPAEATAAQQLTAFHDFLGDPNFDTKAAVQMSLSFSPTVGTIFVNQPFYALPQANPPALQPFTRIQPQLADMTKLDDLPTFATTDAALSPDGSRQMTWAVSLVNDLPTLQRLYEAFNASIPKISKVAGIGWSVTLEPLPPAFLKASAAQGPNSLGLKTDYNGQGLILCDSTFTWTNSNDTALVRQTGLALLNDIIQAARKLGTYNEWVDLNHADFTQDPVASYGPENRNLLTAVSQKYDPGQVFQKRVPGGFKLSGGGDGGRGGAQPS